MEATFRQVQEDIKVYRSESGTQAERVSRYVDDELSKLAEVFSAKHEKAKTMFTKLAEQFKTHLINNDVYRKDTEKRLAIAETNLEEYRADTFKVIGETQRAFETRLLEEKLNIELQM